MDSIVFPKVSLSGVCFMDAINWVQQQSREHTPASVLADTGSIGMTIVLRQGVKETFDVSLRAATLPQVLDAICAQHDYVWCLEPYALTIIPKSARAAGR